MPDLLILDMEIPKTCSQCPMCYDYMMCRPLNFHFAEMESFDCCDELSYVYIPDSVNEMGIWAFDECPRLYISMPSDMTRFIDDYDQTPMHVEER